MEEIERNNGSETEPVSSPVKSKSYVERRVKLNDTYIKKLKRKSKLYSIGDSEMVGLRLYVQPSGSKTFYYACFSISSNLSAITSSEIGFFFTDF